MIKQRSDLLHWKKYFSNATCAIALLLISVQPAFSATKPDGTIEIADGKEPFMSTLASKPYTSSGAGPVLYVLECSKCKSSQAFESDWKGQLDGVEVRRFLIALNAAAANETAYLARTRDITDFYAVMNHAKEVPPIKACNCPDDNKAIQAFNSVEKPLKTVLLPTIMKNGWVKGGPPPQFLWEVNGRVYVSGYSKASFQEILSMLRSGTQAKESSAPPVQQLTKAEPSQQKSSPSVSPDPGLAGTSKPSPDVLGIKVGISRIADVRGALGKVTPILSVQERQAQLRGQSSAGRAYPEWVTIEDAKYLSQLSGITLAYMGTNQGCNANGITGNSTLAHKGNCEEIYVDFSGPPNADVALHLRRFINFAIGPSFESVTRSLVEKYGEPGFHGSAGDRGAVHHFVWAWSAEGNPERLNAEHPCTVLGQVGIADIFLGQENAKTKLAAGCAVVLHAHLTQDNSVVKFLEIVAVDDSDIVGTGVITSAFIDDYVKTFEKKEREKAEKVAAPKF